MRSRDCEMGIKLEYLQGLHKAYEEFLQDISRIIPVIKVNYEQFRTADEMAEMIVRCVVLILYGGKILHNGKYFTENMLR